LAHVSDHADEVVGTIAFAWHSVDAPTIALQAERRSGPTRSPAAVIGQTAGAVAGDGYEQAVHAATVGSSEIFVPTFGSEAWSRPSSGQVFFRVAHCRGRGLVGDRRDASAPVYRRHPCRR